MRDFYGETPKSPIVVEQFAMWLRTLQENGTEATLKHYLESDR